MNNETKGTLLVFITAIISGFSIFANKIFIVDMDPAVFTAVRAMIIGLVFFLMASFQSRFDNGKFKKVPWKYLVAIGVVGGGLAFLLFFSGLQMTTGGRAAFLHKTLPIYVTVLAFIFLKERISRKQLYALTLMIIGTVTLYSATINPAELWTNPSLGDSLIIAATVLWGVENVIAKKAMMKKETNFVVSFARMFFGALFLFGAVIFLGRSDLLFALQPQQLFNLLASTALLFGFVLTYYWSLKYINVSKAASVLLIAPVITLLLGAEFLGEPAPLLQLAGSVIILVGAALIARTRSDAAAV